MGGTNAWQTMNRAVQVVLGQRADVLERNAERVVGDGLAARRADVAAGAIDQDVDCSELPLDVLLHLRDGGLVADIAGHSRDPSAVAGDLLRHGFEVRRLAVSRRLRPGEVVDRDVRAEFGQPLGHRPPEAAARTGDEGDLAGEFPGHVIRSLKFEPRPIARMLAALRRIMASS